jgi:glycerophosphoryl diester phosphodiesterase
MPLLLGHRGLRVPYGPPENTFPAFDLALEHGCDGFEFDVRFTGDGRAVICHDPNARGIAIAEARAGQLVQLPQLEPVLATYASRAFLDIELKVGGHETTVLAAVRAHPPGRRFVVSSFLPEVVQEIHRQDPHIPLGIICDTREQLGRWPELPLQFVIPHHRLVTKELIDNVHNAGRDLVVWTVNKTADMERLAEWGADAIISDDTALLVKTLSRKGR